MQKLKEKLHNQRGFTLVEMLIVVAIIAILIAVSIPMMSSSLEKARHAVDQANKRDAVGLANIEILANVDETGAPAADGTYYYYVNEKSSQGQLVKKGATAPEGFNPVKSQCKNCGGDDSNYGKYLMVEISGDKIDCEWTTDSPTT